MKKVRRESRYGQGSFSLINNKQWSGVKFVLLSALCLCKLALFPARDYELLMFLDTVFLGTKYAGKGTK